MLRNIYNPATSLYGRMILQKYNQHNMHIDTHSCIQIYEYGHAYVHTTIYI